MITEATARQIAFALLTEPELAEHNLDTLTRALMQLARRFELAGWTVRLEQTGPSGAAPATGGCAGLYRQ